MARVAEPTKKQLREWDRWVAGRPAPVRALCERFAPWDLFRMKSTGQRVIVIGYFEDGTLRVYVSAKFNLTDFEREVFGIDPNDLEPCDLPTVGEPVGAMMTQGDVEANIDILRVQTRPDLWRMGDDGAAIWIGEGPAPDESVH